MNVFNIPKELRGTNQQYLYEEKVVAIFGLLFNYAIGLFSPEVTDDINKKLAEYQLRRLDGNKYGAVDNGFTILHGDKEIKLNYPLGLCKGYVAWRYAKYAHTDANFLNHAFSASILRGTRYEGDSEFTYRQGDFIGGNFFLAKWGIKIELTGNIISF